MADPNVRGDGKRRFKIDQAVTAMDVENGLREADIGREPSQPVVVRDKATGEFFHIANMVKGQVGSTMAIIIEYRR